MPRGGTRASPPWRSHRYSTIAPGSPDHPSVVLEQRRFAERMDGFQLAARGWSRRRADSGGFRMERRFPRASCQYALRPAVVQMVDDQAHRILLLSAPISVAIDQRRQLAHQLGADNCGHAADIAARMMFDDVRADAHRRCSTASSSRTVSPPGSGCAMAPPTDRSPSRSIEI